MSPRCLLAAIGAVWIMPACATSSIQREASLAARRIPPDSTIVVVPTRVPSWLAVPEDTLRALDSLIVARLVSTGQPVVAPQTYTAVWDSILRRYEGLRLATAGPLPPDRFQRAQARLFDQLRTQYRAAALVYPEIVFHYAGWKGRTASWDGVSQRIEGKDEGVWGFLKLVITSEDDLGGTVAALSLVVYLQSLEGEDLYVHRGGLELISRYQDGEFVNIEQGVIDDPDHRSRAVYLALEPLFEALRHRAGKSAAD